MARSSWCNYSNPYILVKGSITLPNTVAAGVAVNTTTKKVVFKYCAPFSRYITRMNNTQGDYVDDFDKVMLMHILIEKSSAYSKTSGSLWLHNRDEPALDEISDIIDFLTNNNNSNSFEFNHQITGKTGNAGIKIIEIMVPLKHLILRFL